MSFHPISFNTGTALLGTAVSDPTRSDITQSLYPRGIHGAPVRGPSLTYTLIIIVVSAIIFVTIVSIYDVIRNGVYVLNARASLQDSDTPANIERTLSGNQAVFTSSVMFAVICLVTAGIFIPLLIWWVKCSTR